MKKLPKYLEIVEYFISEIRVGKLKDGDFLPPENELCAKFSASHMTVSKAMGELSAKGYVKRTPGVGTTASDGYRNQIEKSMLKAESMTQLIQDSGLVPGTELIKYAIVRGKDIPDVADILQISDDDFLHFFVRTRYGSGSLICLSYTYIPQSILPTIDITRLLGSFDEYVNELGIIRTHGTRSHCATLPTDEQSKLIGTSHVALLKETVLWYIASDVPFELTYHYFIGDKYTIVQPRVQPRIDQSRIIQTNGESVAQQ